MLDHLKTIADYNAFSRKIALLTFFLGTGILFLYYYTSYSGIIFISLFFMISFLLINSILFIKLIMFYVKNKEERKAIFISLLLMLLNIPIGFLYIEIGFKIYGYINS